MKCPFCGATEGIVLDSRDTPDNEAVRRRRQCEKCGRRWTTYERVEEMEIRVIKKSGKKEAFDREKLRRGIVKATWKRPVSQDKIEGLLDEVEKQLRLRGKAEVTSTQIGNLAIAGLKEIDSLSYLLFACVYRDFNDIEDFKKEIERLEI